MTLEVHFQREVGCCHENPSPERSAHFPKATKVLSALFTCLCGYNLFTATPSEVCDG